MKLSSAEHEEIAFKVVWWLQNNHPGKLCLEQIYSDWNAEQWQLARVVLAAIATNCPITGGVLVDPEDNAIRTLIYSTANLSDLIESATNAILASFEV